MRHFSVLERPPGHRPLRSSALPDGSPIRGRITTLDELEFYRNEGYVAVQRPVVGPHAIAEVRQMLDDLFANFASWSEQAARDLGHGTPDATSIPEILRPSALQPALKNTLVYRTLTQCAQEMLGTKHVVHHFDHAIFKPPFGDAKTAWHQDVAFDPTHDSPVVTFWFALVDATEQNGCMSFVPRSHRFDVLEHRQFGRGGKEAIGIDGMPLVSCPVPAGAFTAHMQRTLHGTGPNTSSETRAAWIVKMIPDLRPAPRRAFTRFRRWQADTKFRTVELQGNHRTHESTTGAGLLETRPSTGTP